MQERIENYNFKVRTLQSGQPRKYADSEYDYEIETDRPEREVKDFCTKILHRHDQPYEKWETGNPGSYFAGYHTFSKIAENKYRYKVVIPFAD